MIIISTLPFEETRISEVKQFVQGNTASNYSLNTILDFFHFITLIARPWEWESAPPPPALTTPQGTQTCSLTT